MPQPCSRYRLPTTKLGTKLPLETRKRRTTCLSHSPAIYATIRNKEHSHLWLLARWSSLIPSCGTPCLVNAISSEWLDPKRLYILCLGKADSTCCKLKHVSSVPYIKSQRQGVLLTPSCVETTQKGSPWQAQNVLCSHRREGTGNANLAKLWSKKSFAFAGILLLKRPSTGSAP